MSRRQQIDGIPVIDAKRALMIDVSARDVAASKPKQPANCAAARACMRELHCIEARIHLARVYIRHDSEKWLRYHTSHALRSELIAFDRGGRFEPGQFTLNVLSDSQRSGARKKRKNPGVRNPTGRKHRSPHVITDVRGGPA